MSGEDVDGKREQLRLFVATSRKRLHAILKRFGWSERVVMEASDHSPHDKDGATASEVLEPLPLPASCSDDPAFSIQLDDLTIQGIVGARRLLLPAASFDDLQAGLDARQRLLIYEHVLQHTKKHPQFQDNAAFAEVVGETRRERKKQRRHRKSKPTLNEELHQLVGLQMQALERQWQQEHDGRHNQQVDRLQEHRGRQNEQTQHRSQTERHQEHKGRHDKPEERSQEHRGRHSGQTQHREGHQEHRGRHNDQAERLNEHKDRGQRQEHRYWHLEHRDKHHKQHKHRGESRRRSRSRSRSRDRGQERQRHRDRRREEREPSGQHHKKHRSHTSRH
ncbi:sarcoplasmic reticulum histidine-rich calcium-binding protein [Drosophila teissieri]|uniref:sarcoplasmic reticulum histidine-rich calcium-binding protein n=1 Tax=Drosophila teissieri TaxID=7243 RepID=UPI001CB9F8A0|nr:sarcoplasmic reticulum histidine-rich calcium-binding protein [Drosophila teissieri]